MKKNKAKAAAKVDALLAEAFTNDEARMQQIREQAHAELLCRTAEQPIKTKKKGLWRSVPALCALVIILIVAPVVATILNPVSYSQANQFVRKATVWVNDTFKLDIELPVEEGVGVTNEVNAVFTSFEEAIEFIGTDILSLNDSARFKLEVIEVSKFSDDNVFVTINYKYKDSKLRIMLDPVMGDGASKSYNTANQIECDAGLLWVWETENAYRAVGSFGNWIVELYAEADFEIAYEAFKSLCWIN